MAKAYLILCYHSVSDENALQEYARLALPAIQSAGGRYLARGLPAKTYENGLHQRTVLIEFDTVDQAVAAHDSPGYRRHSKHSETPPSAMCASLKGSLRSQTG